MNLTLVFIGGGLGATLRWWVSANLHTDLYPYGTLAVNLAGCLLIGIMSVFMLQNPKVSLLLITGFLGGFTTFSSFGLDSFQLLQAKAYKPFLTYVLTSNVLGILLVILGHRIGSLFV